MVDVTGACAGPPAHIGIIMDGNGRWAAQRGLPRVAGHRAGARTVRRIVEAAARTGLRQLTLYAFSSENWTRPAGEVAALMDLLARYLRKERERFVSKDIRLRAIGRLHELPASVRRELARAIEVTSTCGGMTLCLALNYGARSEILDAARRLACDLAAGRVHPERIDDTAFCKRLYQPDMPPLDMVIRTGGEMRLSNFLLWQAAYAELWVTPVAWPEFGEAHLREAIEAFRRRERRFGGTERPRNAGRPAGARGGLKEDSP